MREILSEKGHLKMTVVDKFDLAKFKGTFRLIWAHIKLNQGTNSEPFIYKTS